MTTEQQHCQKQRSDIKPCPAITLPNRDDFDTEEQWRSACLDSLFWQIVSVRSVSGEEGPLVDAVENFLASFSHLNVFRHGDTVVASTCLNRDRRVILCGHLDTVPVIDNFPPQWLEPGDERILEQISEKRPNDRVLWGRGTSDMKASDAVFLFLAAFLDKPKCDITYVFYDNEEVEASKNGLGKLVAAHPEKVLPADFAIIGEPTDCAIEGGCNGTIRFDVISHGVAAHSARAWMGENAIHKVAGILARLSEYEPETISVDGLDYREGLNATLISGGTGISTTVSYTTFIIPQQPVDNSARRYAYCISPVLFSTPNDMQEEFVTEVIDATSLSEVVSDQFIITGVLFGRFSRQYS